MITRPNIWKTERILFSSIYLGYNAKVYLRQFIIDDEIGISRDNPSGLGLQVLGIPLV